MNGTAVPGWEVIRAGPLNTVQDLGRGGDAGTASRLREGIPPAGAMDGFALQIGNLLCGNPRGAAGVEVAPGGLVLRALTDQILALTGADFGAVIDGNSVPRWKSIAIRSGQTLALGAPRAGAWAYLCVSGGIAVPELLGSRATCLAGQFGGWEGRVLKTGDRLPVQPADSKSNERPIGRGLAFSEIPTYPAEVTVRAVRGPQDDRFSTATLATFFTAAFQLTPQSNRMGYRLQGPPLIPTHPDLLSEATAAGAIQVPAGGQPIVLLADRPATGGYPKIATVISADLSSLTQLRPGGTVRFREITVTEAQTTARTRADLLAEIQRGCGVTS